MVFSIHALRPIHRNIVQKSRFASSTAPKRISQTLPTTVPNFVRIVEVGPRDGLQNEKSMVSAATKLALIDKLYKAGLRSIEAGAFVSPKWVPQMADTEEIFKTLAANKSEYPGATFSALTPNLVGELPPHLLPKNDSHKLVFSYLFILNISHTRQQQDLKRP